MTLVSICIPSFNAEATIQRCLQAVLSQGVDDAEILLVDNCSTDRTVEIAREVLAGHPGVRIIQNANNVGRIGNWNRCLEEASGQYVKFAFTNDVLLPGAVRCLIALMEKDPDIGLSGSRQKTVSSLPLQLPTVTIEQPATVRQNGECLEYLAAHGFAALGSLNGMIYRRSFLERTRLKFREDTPYFADFIHAIELASCAKTGFIDAETYLFNEGATGRYHFAGLKDVSAFLQEHRICTDRHMELLAQNQRSPAAAMDYLWGRYFWYLGCGWNLRTQDAIRTFRGFPVLQCRAALKTAWFRFRNPSVGGKS